MSKYVVKSMVVGSAIASLVLAGCGPKKGATDSDRAKPASNVSDSNVGGPAPMPGQMQVSGVKISEKESSTVIRIETSAAPQDNYTVFKLTDPMRVVVDIQNSTMGDVGGPFNVGNGTIGEVSASYFEDEGNKVCRVMIGLDKLLEYTVTTEGNAIVLEIPREGPMPAVTELGTGIGGSGTAMAEAGGNGGSSSSASAATAATPAATDAAAAATPEATPATVAAADASPAPAATEAPLFGDSSTATATPAPAATELPAESVPAATPEATPAASSGGDNGGNWGGDSSSTASATPAPTDATAAATPAATPEQPLFGDSGSSTASSTPAPEATPAATPEQPLFGDSGSSSTSSGSSSSDNGATAAATPTPKGKQRKGKGHKGSSGGTEVAMNTPSSTTAKAGLVKMIGLDWSNKDPNVSRVVIKTQAPVQYQELTPEGNTVVLELSGVRVPKSLERALDTSEFKSAVKLVSTYQAGENARVVVQLRENVNHKVTDAGNNTYYFDFDRPAGMSGGETNVAAADTTQPAATPAADAASAPAADAGTAAAPAADMGTPAASGDMGGMEASAAPATVAQPMTVAQPSAAAQAGLRPQELLFTDPSTTGTMMAAPAGALAGIQGASELENGPQKIYTGRRLNMDFKNADIHNILRLIANVSKLNIVASDAVTGTVTVRLINVPWDQALDIVLQSKKLDMTRQGNIIRIDTEANFAAEREEKKKAKEALSALLPMQTLLLPVSYATANDMKTRLTPFLSKEGSITVDDRTNTLLIQDHLEPLQRIQQLSHTLDTSTPQVLIEARLVEARTAYSRTIGIQWGGAFNPNNTGLFFPNTVGVRGGNGQLTQGPRGTADDNLAINLPGPSAASLALFLGNIGQSLDLDARLGALETEDQIKVISAPRIATLDHQAAHITQGTQIPFLSTSAAGTQTQFVNAALSLNVTPHITNDKSVFLTVQVTNNRPGSIAVGGQPSIDIAEAQTSILVHDGDTAVIGGIYIVSDDHSRQGLPGLSKLPFIGFLFRSTQTTQNRSELLVFMTPRIIARTAPAGGGNG